ncbi:MAG: hypothetical protein WBV92_06060 [Nitrosotalea sp.]
MNWVNDVTRLRHDIFITFIECKISQKGNWENYTAFGDTYKVLRALDNSGENIVQMIEPDGLKRTLLIRQAGTISMNQNVLSYNSGFVSEIVVDEKEQSGKGKTRDKLL